MSFNVFRTTFSDYMDYEEACEKFRTGMKVRNLRLNQEGIVMKAKRKNTYNGVDKMVNIGIRKTDEKFTAWNPRYLEIIP